MRSLLAQIVVLSLFVTSAIQEVVAEEPRIPSALLGNYYDSAGNEDACLSIRERVVSYASLSHDSEAGCGVDMRLTGIVDGELRMLDGDRVVKLLISHDELRFHPSYSPMCAHLGPGQFRFLRRLRRESRPCFE